MADRYTFAGPDGLFLRVDNAARQLPMAPHGPFVNGAYATVAGVESERGRVATEVALSVPAVLALAIADLARFGVGAGNPNPRYTLYRLAPAPQDGVDPEIRYGTALRLETLAEPCDYAQLWTLTSSTPASSAADPLDSATGWTLGNPALAAKLDDGLDATAGWTLGAAADVPAVTTPIANGADLVFLEDLNADWATATAGGWIPSLRWWANSNGPFTTTTAPQIAAWHALVPNGVRWPAWWVPTYVRSAANGKGTIYVDGRPVLGANAALNFNPAAAWTLFVVAKADAAQTAQGTLFSLSWIGRNSGATTDFLELQSGTPTEGCRVVHSNKASRTFAAGLSSAANQILELHAAAGSAVGTWSLAINGTNQTEAAVTGAAVTWTGSTPETVGAGQGGWDSPSTVDRAPYIGCLSEFILLQTDDATTRAAVRAYLAAKFAITIS